MTQIYMLAKANSMHWCGNMLRMKDGHVLRRALDFVAKDER